MGQLEGLGDFEAAIDRLVEAADRAACEFVRDGLHLIEKETKRNMTGKARWRDGQPTERAYVHDGGPGVVSGTLRRGVMVRGPIRSGPGLYSGKVGPTAIYGRAQELGHPHWNDPRGYPSLGPAFAKVKRNDLPRLFRERMARSMRGALA